MWRCIQLKLLYFFWLFITSILVKNSWSICFDKFYQRNQHRVIVFRYFATLSRKCAWRYVQWRIKHFASYDNINRNSFKMKKLQVQCCSVFHSYSGNFVLYSPLLFESFLCSVTYISVWRYLHASKESVSWGN